jgi:hypothetical protein
MKRTHGVRGRSGGKATRSLADALVAAVEEQKHMYRISQ